MGNNCSCVSGERCESNHSKSIKRDVEVEASWPLFVSKYDYYPRTKDDLGFKKGDLLYIMGREDAGWWFAQHKDSGDKGFVPSNYIAEYKSLDTEDWFYGKVERIDAEKLLMQNFNQQGSFLVRLTGRTAKRYYCLTVRDANRVRHYRIKRLDTGEVFLTWRVTFETIQELVEYYKQQADGLCTQLKQACLQAEKPQTAGLSKDGNENWEIDKQSIRLVRKLGVGELGNVWEGQWNNNTAVAVEVLRPGIIRMDKFLQEAAFMIRLRHPRLIQLYGVCTKEEPIYIVTELMPRDLHHCLRTEGRKFGIEQLVYMSAQVAEGMAFLELHCYIYRELTARSILVGDNLICKLADFGLARVISEEIYEARTGVQVRGD